MQYIISIYLSRKQDDPFTCTEHSTSLLIFMEPPAEICLLQQQWQASSSNVRLPPSCVPGHLMISAQITVRATAQPPPSNTNSFWYFQISGSARTCNELRLPQSALLTIHHGLYPLPQFQGDSNNLNLKASSSEPAYYWISCARTQGSRSCICGCDTAASKNVRFPN